MPGWRAVFAIATILLVAQVEGLRGQAVNGAILGTVRDSSGGVIPGVRFSAKSVETGALRSAITNSLGSYQIVSVPAGEYEVEATAKGFKREIRQHKQRNGRSSSVLNSIGSPFFEIDESIRPHLGHRGRHLLIRRQR